MEGERINVLDHGFVKLVDHCGDDARIVQAARVSYGAGTKTVREDARLIDYLVRHHHTSPLEMVNFTFHMKLPIFVARQIVRHRTASINEYSMRYSEAIDEYYVPERDNIKPQSKKNKQGSDGELPERDRELARLGIEMACKIAFTHYRSLLAMGVSRETARIILPVAAYSEWYWQIDLSNLLKFLKLRLDNHAQWETRQYAEAMLTLIEPVVPAAVSSWRTHFLSKE